MQRLLDISDKDQFETNKVWDLLEVAAGLANIQTPTLSQFVPQMLNFQSISAIDFDKGCYMGQEVVARTKFLGKNKRATFLLEGTGVAEGDACAGQNIEVKIGDSWRRGGVVVRSALSEKNQLHLLAVMPNDTVLGTKVRLKDTNTELTVMPMPYEVTS